MALSMTVAIELKVPAEILWETIKTPEIVPKVMPDYVAACEFIEGDGSAGSLRLMKFGPAAAHFVTFSKERIEMVDDAAQKLAYSVIEGELLNHFKSYRVFLEVAKAEDQNGCVVNWALEYEPVDPNMPPPEISKEGAVGTFKAIEAYLLASSLQG